MTKLLSIVAIATLLISGWNWREPMRIAENKFSENAFIFTGINQVPVRIHNNTFYNDGPLKYPCVERFADGSTIQSRPVTSKDGKTETCNANGISVNVWEPK